MNSKKTSKSFPVCFICSPGLGILDNWLPVLYELKRQRSDAGFICIMPKAGIANLIDLDNVLIKLSCDIFDTVILRSHSGLWLQVDTFEQAKDINTLKPVASIILKFSQRISRFFLLHPLSNIIDIAYKFIERKRLAKNIVSLSSVFGSIKVVLYDLLEDAKAYNTEILCLLNKTPKFSIRHGVCTIQDSIDSIPSDISGSGKIKAYLFSEQEAEFYKTKSGLMDNNLSIVGIPRHDKKWIKKILEYSDQHDEQKWDNCVLLISRSLSAYFPYKRKKKALEDIRRVILDKLNMRIIVKCHPKEVRNGLYEEVFGEKEYGERWLYSNKHPFVLGEGCIFAISFYSGVAIDMIAIGIPTVEILDLRGINEYDNNNSLRDDEGDPVFSLRYFGLVLGANDHKQLELQVSKVLNNRELVLQDLVNKYKELISTIDSPGQLVAMDIIKSIDKVNHENDCH